MKHISRLLLVFSCSTLLLCACESEIENEIKESSEELIESAQARTVVTDSLGSDSVELLKMTDDQKALKERMNELKKTKARATSNNYNQYFSENMWAIRELPFTLTIGDGYLSAELGSRRENGIAKFITPRRSQQASDSEKFYVKVPPSIAGIPYFIYSKKSGTPLAVGQYVNNPNQKLLLVMNSSSTSEPATNWDIIPATNRPGYYIIQSESYLGQGNSGSWWDIFNYVIETQGSGNNIGFGQYLQKAAQEFVITPDAIFKLKNLEFINTYSATLNQKENLPIQIATTNSSSQQIRKNLEFTKDVEESSYFEEEKGIAFRSVTSDLQFARPTVTLGEIDLTPNTEIPIDTKYEINIHKTLPKTLHQLIPVVVKPRTKLVMTYYYKVYDISIDYVATIEYNDRIAKVPGRWSGRVYVDEIFEPDFEEINLDTQRSVKGKVNIKSATLSSPITF